MNKRMFVIVTTVLLAGAGAAMAQSHQGGYLGVNPGGHLATPSQPPPPEFGSGQGGYLGRNPGEHLAAPIQPPPSAFGSGEGGYLGLIPGKANGVDSAGSTTPTANPLSRAPDAQ
jgi:hypothetical protein